MAAALRHGDIVKIEWPVHDVPDPAPGPQAPVSGVLGLVETDPVAGSAFIAVWSPLALWTGRSQFDVRRDHLALVGHLRFLDVWSFSIMADEQEQRFTLPALIAMDRPRRLRVAFLSWVFEGPLRTEAPDWETVLFLAEQ